MGCPTDLPYIRHNPCSGGSEILAPYGVFSHSHEFLGYSYGYSKGYALYLWHSDIRNPLASYALSVASTRILMRWSNGWLPKNQKSS